MYKFLLLCFVFLTPLLQAQKLVNETGIIGGINFHYAFNYSKEIRQNAGAGFAVGLTNNLYFSKRSSINTALLYEKRNKIIEYNPDYYILVGINNYVDVTQTYITLPVLYRYTFGSKRLQKFVNAGAQLSYGFSDKYVAYGDNLNPVSTYTSTTNNHELNVALALGGGIVYSVNKHTGLSLELRQTGFIYSHTVDGYTGKHNTVGLRDDDFIPFATTYLLAGYHYRFGK